MKIMKTNLIKNIFISGLLLFLASCKTPFIAAKIENSTLPPKYLNSVDSLNSASISWRRYFSDPFLEALIDTALYHNQELNITLQEIEMSKNEVNVRKGEYLPFINLGAGLGPDKAGKYTWDGFSEEDLKLSPNRGPKYIGDFIGVANMTWELDVWKNLETARNLQ